ncbi:DUF1198 family protein [Escherichia coli]
MIWIMLATLAVVFVVGFRVLTSGARKAIRRLSDRLNIDVVPVESMVDQMGKSAGDEFLRYLHRPDESHLQNAAQVLLIWQIVIVDGSEQNLLQWHRILQKARLAAPITDAQVRLALGFCAKPNLKCRILMLFRCAITRSFSLPRAFTGCIKTASSYQPTDRA